MVKDKDIIKKLEPLRKEMRKKGAFSKYCADCGEIIGSDDMEEFLSLTEKHSCKKGKRKIRRIEAETLPMAG